MLWIFLQLEVSVNDTVSFKSKVMRIIPKYRAKIISDNKVVFLNPGRAIVVTKDGNFPIFVRRFDIIKLPYDSLILYVNDSFNLNFGDYKYEIRPKNIGYIKDNKLYLLEPGLGFLILRKEDSIGRIKIIVKEKNKNRVEIPIDDKIVMDVGERLVFNNYKISTNSNKLKISNDTIISLSYGIANVKFVYEDDKRYGFKNVMVIIKPKVLDIIAKPKQKIKLEGKEIEIVRERGNVTLEGNYLDCENICFGILKVDGRLIPFLIHPNAYREDEDKDFIVVKKNFEIPDGFEFIRIFPKKKFEISDNKIIVKERGLGFAVVKTKRGITILKIIGIPNAF